MNWFSKFNQIQYTFPFKDQPTWFPPEVIRRPKLDGQYHCAYCDKIIPENELSEYWDTKNLNGKNIIQKTQEAETPVSFIFDQVKNILEQYDNSNLEKIKTEIYNFLKQQNVFIPIEYPTDITEFKRLVYSYLRFLAARPKKEVHYQFVEQPICPECIQQYLKQCNSCEKIIKPEQSYFEFEGNYYCKNCCEICKQCLTQIPSIYITEGICPECQYANEIKIEQVIEKFLEKNPQLNKDIIEKAIKKEPQEPTAYIRIFSDLNWVQQYGGKTWAEIAKTWLQLEQIRNSGELVNWNKAMLIIDHCFDLVHNTGSLFSKAPKDIQSWIIQSLDEKKYLSPEVWINQTSNDVRKLHEKYHAFNTEKDKFISYPSYLNKEKQISTKNIISQMINELLSLPPNFQKARKLSKMIPAKKSGILKEIYYQLIMDPEDSLAIPMAKLFKINSEGTLDEKKQMIRYFLRTNPDKIIYKHDFLSFFVPLIKQTFRHVPTLNEHWISLIRKYDPSLQFIKDQISATSFKHITKTANQLNKTIFCDFYALIHIDCSVFSTNEDKQYCSFIKRETATKVIDCLLPIISTAVIEEAAHVKSQIITSNHNRSWLNKIAQIESHNQMMPIEDLKKYVDPNVPLNRIRADERNYLEHLKKQIKEKGILQPLQLIPYRNSYLITDGHHRLAAAEELGIKELPVVIIT